MTCICEREHEPLCRIAQSLEGLRVSLDELHRKADKIMTQQDDLNAVGTEIEADVAAIGDGIVNVEAEIAALELAAQNGQPLDFTAVRTALADLGTATATVTAAGTEVPAPVPPSA